jgi:AcrR family transcriptional regulator
MARLPRAERRRQILAAAIEVFAKSGFGGVRTKRIAGVSEATIVQHFPTKRDLYDAVLEERLRGAPAPPDLVGELERSNLRKVLTQFAHHLVTAQHRDRRILRLMLYAVLEDHALARELYDRHLARPVEAVTRALRAARTTREIRGVEPAKAAQLFVAIVAQYILEREVLGTRGRGARRATIEDYVDIYLRGILAPRRGR